MRKESRHVGGVIHTYQRYDPTKFPSPLQPPPDLASLGLEHLLAYGSTRRLTEEELARAIRLDPSQFKNLGPSIDSIIRLLEERKRKILETYETKKALGDAKKSFDQQARNTHPPDKLRKPFDVAVREEQLRDLEMLYYRAGDDHSDFARQLVHLLESLGRKYEVDQLAANYAFTGRTPMSVDKAIEIKEELEEIDRLLKQLREAMETAQLAIIDMDALSEFADEQRMNDLGDVRRQIADYLRALAEQQGLERGEQGYNLTPKAYRLFQSKLLERIFADLKASRTGRHANNVAGEGAVETQRTKPYEFGDSVANLDALTSLTNAMVRNGTGLPVRWRQDDLEIHITRNNPKAATVVVMDMSGSMRQEGQYVNVKRMALALDGLIRKEYPGDFLRFIEMFTFAKPRAAGELATLMPKMPTIRDPVVRLRADMSDPNNSESRIHPHFTNIQHALLLARRLLAATDTPNRQIIIITDGLPTAHFEGRHLYMLYPPDPRTESATLREGQACAREGITINLFLVPSWSQSEDDIRFAYRLAESTKGRVFFTAGNDLDRYVVWDYVNRTRKIIA